MNDTTKKRRKYGSIISQALGIRPFKASKSRPRQAKKNIIEQAFGIAPIKVHTKHDSDKDRVPDYKDCQPFNFRRQDKDVISYEEFEKIRSDLLKGKKVFDLTYLEFSELFRKLLNRVPHVIISYRPRSHLAKTHKYAIVGIRKKGITLYHLLDVKTGMGVLANRTSREELLLDIREGQIEELKDSPRSNMFSVLKKYKSTKAQLREEERTGGRAERFPKVAGQRVLDVGAGDNPDLRATHAIDLVRPEKVYEGLNYKYGYDFDKETTKLPYPSNSFDVVVSIGGLGRNFRSRKIYAEIYRVLKRGGRLEFNPTDKETRAYLTESGFKDIHYEIYFDRVLRNKIQVVVARKL